MKIALIGAAVAVIAAGWAAKLHFDAEARREEMVGSLRQIQGAIRDPQGSGYPQPPITASRTAPTTEAAVVADAARFIGEISRRNEQYAASYTAKLAELNLEGWLATAALADSGYRARQRTNLQRASQALDQYSGELRQSLQEMKDYGAKLAAASPAGATFNRGLLDSMPQSERMTEEILATERQLMKQVASIYDFLDRPDVRYTVQGKDLKFEQKEHEAAYRAAFGDIQRAGLQSEEAQRKAQTIRNEKLDNLGDIERRLSTRR